MVFSAASGVIGMFHQIPHAVQAQMTVLENRDAQDRTDGTPRMQRLRQVPPQTGRFLALMAAAAPPKGAFIEIGTSAGYSALWLSLACALRGEKLTTFEILPEKFKLAEETFHRAAVAGQINLVLGDAREHLPRIGGLSFCFLDAEKEVYQDCYDGVVPWLVDGGLLLVDNVISHQAGLTAFLDAAHADQRVDTVVLPVGKGVLLCRKRDDQDTRSVRGQ
jgi:predicted O-methyltransferase YrrM